MAATLDASGARPPNGQVAILLATWNGAPWLHEQIQSLRAQTHPQWCLYVSDDHSDDSTLEIVRSYAAIDSRIVLLPPPASRSGSATGNFLTALNHLRDLSFDYLAFCDQDDIWAPEKLARALHLLLEKQAEGYSCDLVAFDTDKRTAQYLGKHPQQRSMDYLFQGASAGCTYVLTRKAAEQVSRQLARHPDAMLRDKSHDWLVYAICRSYELRWWHEPAAHIFYRQHASNLYGAMQKWSGLVKKLRLAQSGWYRQHILWNRQFLQAGKEQDAVFERLARYRLVDRLWLALRARQYRREPRQALMLAVLLILGWM